MNKLNSKQLIMLLIVMVCILFSLIYVITSRYNKYIDNYIIENKIEVKEKINHYTIIGTPYYYNNNNTVIVEVKSKSDTTYWFRQNFYKYDVLKTTK